MRAGPLWAEIGMKAPARIPILYLILAVLVLVSVVPMYFYATYVEASNRERRGADELLSQNTVTRSMAEDIGQRLNNLRTMLANFTTAVEVTSGGDLSAENLHSSQLRQLLERFVASSNDLAYATLLNTDSKGISAGRVQPDPFMAKELERASVAALDGRSYNGQPLSVDVGRGSRTVMLISVPLTSDGQCIGVIATFIDLQFLIDRLKDASTHGLHLYVVDSQGRLVANSTADYATGQDMSRFEIVKNVMDPAGRAQQNATRKFSVVDKNDKVPMLGTYAVVPTLNWAVIAQKTEHVTYEDVLKMQRVARWLAVLSVLASTLIASMAARRITTPLQILTETSRAIARGDFSQRVTLKNRTEIGELAATFNHMTADLEKLVADLKGAAEENRSLFLSSIQMLAGAVDEKDPYTRGHSDRVTRYSVLIAQELGLTADEVERIHIAAQLHDVGKIGIEDRVLKKPGALTPDEYDMMKRHTTKGANILRPVRQLAEVIPGIELHHESIDGRGYPHGLKGDAIPLMARIIMVADAFDAMTTDRPYQAAMDPEYVIRIITSLTSTRFDPRVVSALTAVFKRNELMPQQAPVTIQAAAANA